VIYIEKEFKAAPLSSAFVLTSIFGFLISVFYITNYSVKFGAAFALVFLLMFIASFISMMKGPIDDKEFDNDLSIHEPNKHPRRHRIKIEKK